MQISGDTEDVMGIDDIRDRWTAFGWEVKDMNGDDMEDIIRTFRSIDYANHHPHLLVAHTTKGKGVSFMEGVAKWHHGVPNNEQYELAIREISERIKNLEYIDMIACRKSFHRHFVVIGPDGQRYHCCDNGCTWFGDVK